MLAVKTTKVYKIKKIHFFYFDSTNFYENKNVFEEVNFKKNVGAVHLNVMPM
jgi:hypothetical protein